MCTHTYTPHLHTSSACWFKCDIFFTDGHRFSKVHISPLSCVMKSRIVDNIPYIQRLLLHTSLPLTKEIFQITESIIFDHENKFIFLKKFTSVINTHAKRIYTALLQLIGDVSHQSSQIHIHLTTHTPNYTHTHAHTHTPHKAWVLTTSFLIRV